MKIVGQMAISNFPFWEMCLIELSKHVDELYIRFDSLNGDTTILDKLENKKLFDGKIKNILISNSQWNRWNWREEMIRMLDSVKPTIVLSIDQDETFCDGIDSEIKQFLSSDKQAMMFSYSFPMPSDDGRIVWNGKCYPGKPHMKAYKWIPNLTYKPYSSFAKIRNYRDATFHFQATTLIKHFCFYTKELEIQKLDEFKKRKNNNI